MYNRAAASMVGIDRFKDANWTKLETNINVVKKLQSRENKPKIIKKSKVKNKRQDSGFW